MRGQSCECIPRHMLIEPPCRRLRRPRCRPRFPRCCPPLPPPSRLRHHPRPLRLHPPLLRPPLPRRSPTLSNGIGNGKCALQHLSDRPVHTLLVEATIDTRALKALNTLTAGVWNRPTNSPVRGRTLALNKPAASLHLLEKTLYLLFLVFLLLFLVIVTLSVCYYDDYFLLQVVGGVTLTQSNLLVHSDRLRGCSLISFLQCWKLLCLQDKAIRSINILLIYLHYFIVIN